MELVHGLLPAINGHDTVLTIGAFDGVHRGHQHLIGSAVRRARELGCQSAVLTFDPHPDLVIHPDRDRLYLTSLEERAELIAGLGADLLIVMPFTRETMGLTALEFMSQVRRSVALCELWIGWDFALGRKREGNLARLRELGQQLGYSVHPVDAFALADGTPVSSTRIRNALAQGDLETAALLLGRSFAVQGLVVEGDRRGRTIGFPTANIDVDPRHVLPADGVYVCDAEVGGRRYGAVTNIGLRPTFDGTRRKVEAYLLDFVDTIYGDTLRLTLRHRLRGEQKFDGIAALITQITADVAAARAWLREHPVGRPR
ncbi:MAG TPA: bifunctional riboflavin kinase/FAD synthetase [Roseiflexaceae bacterium]|nr:bifunctional riboflavin kinase/FAD synthetase [Roseiflexaceae bacterium]